MEATYLNFSLIGENDINEDKNDLRKRFEVKKALLAQAIIKSYFTIFLVTYSSQMNTIHFVQRQAILQDFKDQPCDKFCYVDKIMPFFFFFKSD